VNLESRERPRWPKWTLFMTSFLTVPVPFFMLVVGGIVPTVYTTYLAIQGLVVALPKFTTEGFWMLGILWAHVLILGGLLYVAAVGTTWVLFRLFPHRFALLSVVLLIVALLVLSIFEIYRVPGHNSSPPANLFRIFSDMTR
jgi:hypothetical protein